MALTGQQYTLVAGEHEATVVEVGAGLRAYRHRGVEVTVPYSEDELPPKGTGATLVPWPNRLRGGTYTFDGVSYQLALTDPSHGNAIHGLARWIRWLLVRFDDSSVTLAIELVPQTGWPFEVRVEVTYALHAEHGLSVTATATNHGATRAPFGAGFHPYLSVHDQALAEVSVKVPARERLLLDDALVPIGVQAVAHTPYDLRRGRRLRAMRLDDGFTGLSIEDGRSAVVVRTKRGGAQVWFDATFGYVQVFTPELLAHGRAGVAVEPMTCPADAFNSGAGLIVLEPGGAWMGSWGIAPLA
jgi:aldose 1-epimerase